MRHLTNITAARTGRSAGAMRRLVAAVVVPCGLFTLTPVGEVTP